MVETEIDLAELAQILGRLPENLRQGFVVGKTAFRDALVEKLGCSELEAERLVDTLELRGFLHFSASRIGPPLWVFSDFS